MHRYITVRLGQAIITLVVLSLAVFLSVHLTGDPALYLLGQEGEGRKAEYEQMKKNMGLDKPLVVQYGLFLSKAVRADFGKSHLTGRSARQALLERFPATLVQHILRYRQALQQRTQDIVGIDGDPR